MKKWMNLILLLIALDSYPDRLRRTGRNDDASTRPFAC